MRGSAAWLLLAVASACQLVASSDVVQCKSDQDCAARGGSFAGSICQRNVCIGPLECVGSVVWSPQDNSETVRSNMLLVNILNQPLAGVKVRVCEELDTSCTTPLATFQTD